jgi:hypothetical protein
VSLSIASSVGISGSIVASERSSIAAEPFARSSMLGRSIFP